MNKLEGRFGFNAAAAPSTRVPGTAPQPTLRPKQSRQASCPGCLRTVRLCEGPLPLIGRLGQQRDVVLLDEAEPHAVAVQPTLLAQGDSGACGASEVTLIADRNMEPLWSPAVATSGKRWQMHRRRKPRKQAKSFAAGSYQLPANLHGKGGGRRFESVRGLRVFACSHDLALLEHGLMMPAMLVPMLFRLAGHAGHDGHGKR
jgi:hypothetical protein